MTWQEDAEVDPMERFSTELHTSERQVEKLHAEIARLTAALEAAERERDERLTEDESRALAFKVTDAEQRVKELEAALREWSEWAATVGAEHGNPIHGIYARARAALREGGESGKPSAPPENPSNRFDKRGRVL